MDFDHGTACRTRPHARHAAGFQDMKPLAQCDDDNFGAQYLHLRYGRSSAIPLASRDSLPPHAQSSVPAWWLAFGRVGFSNRSTSAFLGTLMIVLLLSFDSSVSAIGSRRTESFQCLERAGAEFTKPWNSRQVLLGVHRGQRREQESGEEGDEREGAFHGWVAMVCRLACAAPCTSRWRL